MFAGTCYPVSASPPKSAGDKPRSVKNRTVTNMANHTPNNEPVKKKFSQKTKEMLTPFKEKQMTGIPVKQNIRPMSSSNKLRLSSSGSAPTKPNKSLVGNSASFTMQGPINVRNIKASPAVAGVRSPNEGLTRYERHEINKQKLKTALNNRAQVLQFELANTINVIPQRTKKTKNCTKRSLSPSSQHSLSIGVSNAKSDPRKSQQNGEKKSITTYKVQQKDDDDFVCGRKHSKPPGRVRKLSSESTIYSDKEYSPGNAFCTDSEVNDEAYDTEHQKQTKLSNARKYLVNQEAYFCD